MVHYNILNYLFSCCKVGPASRPIADVDAAKKELAKVRLDRKEDGELVILYDLISYYSLCFVHEASMSCSERSMEG